MFGDEFPRECGAVELVDDLFVAVHDDGDCAVHFGHGDSDAPGVGVGGGVGVEIELCSVEEVVVGEALIFFDHERELGGEEEGGDEL